MRVFLRGAGYSASFVRRRPVVGICTSWSELTPCNLGLRRIAESVKRGVTAAGGLPLEFPTISLSESMMEPSTLFLRNLMSIDVEQMIVRSPIDVVVLLNGCDKTVPAQLMGALSAGKPAISIAAGPRPPVRWRDRTLTIDDLWRADDDRRSGAMTEDDWIELEGALNSGHGTCNVMGTATTMAAVAEVMGMAMPGTSLLQAGSAPRDAAAEETGARAVALASEALIPQRLITPEALENAFRVVCAIGGSTNAVIHLEAIAGRIGWHIGFDRLTEWSKTTPVLAGVRPSGPHLIEDLHAVGGIPAVMQELGDLLHLDALAGDGQPWSTVTRTCRRSTGSVLATRVEPLQHAGGIALLRGSLAPRGAVLKRTASGTALHRHRGLAVTFNGADDLSRRIDDPALPVDARSVLVLRNVGPVGGPGMPEVRIPVPEKLLREGITDVLRISDGRMSGTGSGTVVLHVSEEAAVGGPIGLVEDGDEIEIDVEAGRLDLLVSEDELSRRRSLFKGQAPPTRGYDELYWGHVLQAHDGADLDFLELAREPGHERLPQRKM